MTNLAENITPLNPADYFTLAMDEEIRRDGMPGSFGCFGLELSQLPNMEVLEQRIEEFCSRFPKSRAKLKKIGKRYYWFNDNSKTQLFFHHRQSETITGDSFQHHCIHQLINHHQQRETTDAISFHLISSPSRNIFLIYWLHPFSDAKGADLILQFLCSDEIEQRRQFGLDETPLFSKQMAKFNWWQKIKLLFKAKRYIARLDRQVSSLPLACQKQPESLNFHITRLSPELTLRVTQQARQTVGLTGTSLYYIGCFMRAVNRMQPEKTGDAFCAPYAFNLRRQKALTPVTGNHLSALFAQAPLSIIHNRTNLFEHLKKQYGNVIKNQLDYAFLPLMWAGSWLSLERYGKILRLSERNFQERSSFWFSDIGQLDLSRYKLAGSSIENIFHISQVTSPPAIALLCSIFNDRLTVSYSFVEPCCHLDWIEQLHSYFIEELLAD